MAYRRLQPYAIAAGKLMTANVALPARRVPRPMRLSVFYDGACPLCRREIAFYQRRAGAERIRWIDVARCDDTLLPTGTNRETLLKRFHIITESGDLMSGGAAFSAIWAQMPMFRPLSWLARIPGATTVLEISYRFFLQFRPRLQRWLSS